jgi:flagellum-specific ATP synthase
MVLMPDFTDPVASSPSNPDVWDIHQLIQKLNEASPYWIRGQVRRCQGALAVCEGLNDLIGLGEACWIKPVRYNPHECQRRQQPPPLLAEVVAIDEAGAHLLPFERLDGIGVGARVTVARDQDHIRPTDAWLGRVLDAFGRPLDGRAPPPDGTVPLPLEGAAGRGPSPA